jgi:hypothetical protein
MLLAARVQGVANQLAGLSDAECDKIARQADNLLSLFEVLIVAARKPAAD